MCTHPLLRALFKILRRIALMDFEAAIVEYCKGF